MFKKNKLRVNESKVDKLEHTLNKMKFFLQKSTTTLTALE